MGNVTEVPVVKTIITSFDPAAEDLERQGRRPRVDAEHT